MAAGRRHLVRRGVAATVALVLLALGLAGPALARPAKRATPRPAAAVSLDRMSVTGADNAVLQWNAAALQAVRDTTPPPPVAARALAVLHTAMFDAWAAYEPKAVGTRLGPRLRRPAAERTPANKRAAVSYAAFRALADLFPAGLADFQARLRARRPCGRGTGVEGAHGAAGPSRRDGAATGEAGGDAPHGRPRGSPASRGGTSRTRSPAPAPRARAPRPAPAAGPGRTARSGRRCWPASARP